MRFDGIFSSGHSVRITKRGYVSTAGSPSSCAAQKIARPASTNGPYASIACTSASRSGSTLVGVRASRSAARRVAPSSGRLCGASSAKHSATGIPAGGSGSGRAADGTYESSTKRPRSSHATAAGVRERADVDAANGHPSRAMADDAQPRWWSMRRAQSLKPATYRCPLCGRQLHAMSEHVLIAPEGDASRRRHAHAECAARAHAAGRLPTLRRLARDPAAQARPARAASRPASVASAG